MYESLLEWCKFPIYVYNNNSMSLSGDIQLDPKETYYGYRVDEAEQIVDKSGKEYLSATKVYFPPCVEITADDKIAFTTTETPREIRKVGGFYDGNTGTIDIKVVYL